MHEDDAFFRCIRSGEYFVEYRQDFFVIGTGIGLISAFVEIYLSVCAGNKADYHVGVIDSTLVGYPDGFKAGLLEDCDERDVAYAGDIRAGERGGNAESSPAKRTDGIAEDEEFIV